MPDRAFTRAVEAWFATNRRDLPWRVEPKPGGGRNPYFSLVSEVMLQQTQAARVAERFVRFITRFPDAETLARAQENEVLAEWTGLGYNRRAKSLHAAARAIVEHHDGAAPRDVDALRALPGVGRYTAGAIASVCFGVRTPIVDANIARVLLRVEGKRLGVSDPSAQRFAWERAESLVNASESPGLFNEGLMELGALVCTPRNPRCPVCPLRRACRAHAEGAQHEIPLRASKPAKPVAHHAVVVVRAPSVDDEVFLVEQRPARGLWATLWQAPTLETDEEPTPDEVRAFLAARLKKRSIPARDLLVRASFTRVTSSKAVRFSVFECARPAAPTGTLRAASRDALLAGDPPLSLPHRGILLERRGAEPA